MQDHLKWLQKNSQEHKEKQLSHHNLNFTERLQFCFQSSADNLADSNLTTFPSTTAACKTWQLEKPTAPKELLPNDSNQFWDLAFATTEFQSRVICIHPSIESTFKTTKCTHFGPHIQCYMFLKYSCGGWGSRHRMPDMMLTEQSLLANKATWNLENTEKQSWWWMSNTPLTK